ncbi:MAG: response regulator transcription factor [Opitutales bacterium]|nr:response regulator transcription factor [Opitutales bacterium]
MNDKKILIVEDEDSIAELIEFNVQKNGFKTARTDSAEKARKILENGDCDLILLDLMLAGMDGLDFCKIFRQDKSLKQIPIIILTARSEDADIVSGLEFGANDYITKPFSPRVLIARIKAQLRDSSYSSEKSQIIKRGGIELNKEFHEVKIGDRRLELTANEFSILELFLENPGKVYSRDAIITNVHGDGYPVTDRSIDVAIVNLRKKLEGKAKLIETVRGVGYRFKQD